MSNIKGWIRIVILLCGVALFFVLITPIWRIDLDAPQYPEGLALQIHANGIKGDVEIINGLNHYIGMKTLHNEDFLEFKVLPYIITFFAVAFLLAAFLNKRKIFNLVFILFVAFGIVAMYDFWRWEYNYGHNLNPNAAIVVPGMAYQPPLIGFKQLLNFGAYSFPDIGGWIFIAVGALALFCFISLWSNKKKQNLFNVNTALLIVVSSMITLSSCSTKPEPIKSGTDNCYFCKMTITDAKFAAEIVTTKGKVFKFDDIHCLQSFTKAKTVDKKEIGAIYFSDYNNGSNLINAQQSFLLKSEQLKTPMNGNIAAFGNIDSFKKYQQQFSGVELNKEEILQ